MKRMVKTFKINKNITNFIGFFIICNFAVSILFLINGTRAPFNIILNFFIIFNLYLIIAQIVGKAYEAVLDRIWADFHVISKR